MVNIEDIINCCDRCIYNQVKLSEWPDYQLCNVILILLTRYNKKTYFAELNLSAKLTRLLTIKQSKIVQILGGIVFTFEEILNNFATKT